MSTESVSKSAKKRSLVRLPSIHCPHCGQKSIVRNSGAVTDLVRELRNICTNDDCAHVFVSQLSVVRTIRPSLKPKAGVRLPLGELRLRPANDDMPIPDNDEHLPAALTAPD